MRLLWTKANYIYHRHEYDKNTVRKDVKCFHFIAYWVIGLHWWCQIEIDKKCKHQLVNSDRVRTNFTLVVNIGPGTIYVSKRSCFENLQYAYT